jgi:hypothetical protein
MSGNSATRSATASVSAGIAAATAHLPKATEPGARFPGENVGRSLAEMAHRDLDAALQLLAERAHYITGASGAAIALRRGDHNDMLCRASAGSNAPDLGALLSMDYGLSGESVRTRQVLRCDDADRDPRVNHEVCHQLGIASVVVMPIVSDRQVLGVFELLSGEPHAFGERDLSALRRLSEMVEGAVKYAVAAQTTPALEGPIGAEAAGVELADAEMADEELEAAETHAIAPVIPSDVAYTDLPVERIAPEVVAAAPDKGLPQKIKSQESTRTESERTEVAKPKLGKTELEKTEAKTPESHKTIVEPPKKPLFWSAAIQSPGTSVRPEAAAESVAVPPGLRKLQKCKACGFPVSQGRTFCVECEEKQWRGQRLPQPAAAGVQPAVPETRVGPPTQESAAVSPSKDIASPRTNLSLTGAPAIFAPAKVNPALQTPVPAPIASTVSATQSSASSRASIAPAPAKKDSHENVASDISTLGATAPLFSSAIESQSWFSSNKYILGALLLVAVVIAVIALR